MGEPRGSWRGWGWWLGGLLSHPPSLKLDAAGEADREINWAFSKTRRRGESEPGVPPASLLGFTPPRSQQAGQEEASGVAAREP